MSAESAEPEIPVPPSAEAPASEASPDPDLDRYECRACGYDYEPTKGDSRGKVPAGVPFADLPAVWKCPVCGAPKTQFSNIGPAGSPSGFKENLSYGLGVNTMTPGQKNILIFGSLALAVLFFLSLYGLR